MPADRGQHDGDQVPLAAGGVGTSPASAPRAAGAAPVHVADGGSSLRDRIEPLRVERQARRPAGRAPARSARAPARSASTVSTRRASGLGACAATRSRARASPAGAAGRPGAVNAREQRHGSHRRAVAERRVARREPDRAPQRRQVVGVHARHSPVSGMPPSTAPTRGRLGSSTGTGAPAEGVCDRRHRSVTAGRGRARRSTRAGAGRRSRSSPARCAGRAPRCAPSAPRPLAPLPPSRHPCW